MRNCAEQFGWKERMVPIPHVAGTDEEEGAT